MTPGEIDRILSSEDMLTPSSNFVTETMAAIRQQASEPSYLPFPWFRFAAGLVASGGMAATGTVILSRVEPVWGALAAPLAQLGRVAPELGYAAAAILVSLGLAFLPRLFSSAEE